MKFMTLMISGWLVASVTDGALAASRDNAGPAPARASSQAMATPGAPMSATERRALIQGIVKRWSGYVRQVHGTEPAVWARSMDPIFRHADPANLRQAAAMSTYEGMVATVLGQPTSDAAIVDALARTSSPVVIQTLGSPANDLVYTMLTPCRIVDTRVAGGVIPANSTRSFKGSAVGTTFAAIGQGGDASDCGIPAGPSAIVVDVTAVAPAGNGYLTIFPYNVTRPLAASLTYSTGAVVSNEIIAKLTIGQAFDFSAYTYQQSHLVVDVVGYFMAPVATALNTTTTSTTGAIANGVDGTVAYPACPASYARTGGYCYGAMDTPGATLLETGGNFCTYRNASGAEMFATAVSQCARIPGR